MLSLLRVKIAELPKEKAFGEFGFFVLIKDINDAVIIMKNKWGEIKN